MDALILCLSCYWNAKCNYGMTETALFLTSSPFSSTAIVKFDTEKTRMCGEDEFLTWRIEGDIDHKPRVPNLGLFWLNETPSFAKPW